MFFCDLCNRVLPAGRQITSTVLRTRASQGSRGFRPPPRREHARVEGYAVFAFLGHFQSKKNVDKHGYESISPPYG